MYKTIDDIPAEALFGRKLFKLGEGHHIKGLPAIAEALYEKDECYQLIRPKGRDKNKHSEFRDADIAAIRRRVQDHFLAKSASEIKSHSYLLAYSVLFNCSMDYLYDKVSEECPNVEVLDISRKTGLSVKAVEKLMANREVCMEEWLYTADRLELLETPVYNGENCESDTDNKNDDDPTVETYASVTNFWNDLIESDLFTSIPEYWHHLACTKYTGHGIKLILDDLKKVPDAQLTPDTVMPWAILWQRLHPEENTLELPWLTDETAYTDYQDATASCFREIVSALSADLTEKADHHETAYWGLAHKLERNLMTYFEKKAEDWINHGPLPPYKE